tara:strand:+ start:1056 stop:1184 length:129 start_codon:yes stop_codon:yes gene_type:complete
LSNIRRCDPAVDDVDNTEEDDAEEADADDAAVDEAAELAAEE